MAYDQGEAARRSLSVHNASGVAVDADATPTYTVTLPDGTAGIPPTVQHEATGEYFVLYLTTTPGMHSDTWTATVSGQLARFGPSAFRVRSAVAAGLLDLTEARRILGLGADPIRDEDVRDEIEAATADVERATGRTYRRQTVTAERHIAAGRNAVALRRSPVVAVTTVTDAGVTLAPTQYVVNESAGVVTLLAGRFTDTGPVTVTYTAGNLDVDGDVLAAVRLALRVRWRNRKGAAGAPAAGADPLDAQLRMALDRLPHAIGVS